VPEEQQYLGNVRAASQFQAIEKQVFHTCYKFVAVSEAMVEHYHAKYGSTSRKANWVLLPLTSPICADIDERSTDDSELVVYSGGSQKWQNVEMMIAAIRNSCDRYRFEIITQTPEAFDSISDRALVRTIAAEEVNKVYKRSGLGFLLRDDTVVNRVALPTKLIEYVSCGVVPIMLSDKLGDARSVGIAFARLEDFAADKIDSTQLAIARSANLNAIKRLNEQSQAGRKALLDICSTIASGADKDYGLRHAKRDARKQMILDELTRLPGRAIRAPRKLLRILRGDSLETKEI
jgi:hypothetical protein